MVVVGDDNVDENALTDDRNVPERRNRTLEHQRARIHSALRDDGICCVFVVHTICCPDKYNYAYFILYLYERKIRTRTSTICRLGT